MAQRLVRAKKRIRAAGIPFVLPERDDLTVRLPAVLEAVYGAYAIDWHLTPQGPPGRWDATLIARGEVLLHRAHALGRPGRFQYEAAIQSAHCAGTTSGGVDLVALQRLHRALALVAPSLGAAVASAAVDGDADGPDAGLRALDAIIDPAAERFQPFWATRAHLLAVAGRSVESADAYQHAIALTADPGVVAYLLRGLRTVSC